MSDERPPEPDRVEGAPHPRETARIFGQETAEAAFLDAVAAGRLHHAWLITGPRGVGKATLGWRIARFLLSQPATGADGPGLFGDVAAPGPATTLDLPPDDPVARRVLAGTEPRLFHLRRTWDDDARRLRTAISVDEVRRLKAFFQLTAADGGRRVALVDAADDLNLPAANALLKLLEEPPADAVLLLVSHRPAGLLPTIRSRCRELRLAPLAPADLAAALAAAGAVVATDEAGRLAALAGGSVGEALRLLSLDGLAAYAEIIALFADSPGIDRQAAMRLSETAAGRGAEPRADLLASLMDLFLARLARSGIVGPPDPEAGPGEAALMRRLSPDAAAARHWAGLQTELGERLRRGRAVNLDPAALLLDMVLRINRAAGVPAARSTGGA